ncbi:TspO and MBR related proteins [Micrococcales bacterium KH10]|nr:TspO and MBR related proteins [Micrococcales bacterium KH10]
MVTGRGARRRRVGNGTDYSAVGGPTGLRHAPSVARRATILTALIAGVVAIAVGGVLANRGNVDGWYANAEKVAWNPPNWVFAPAWTTLYVMIVIVGYWIWRQGFRGVGLVNANRAQLRCYLVQLILNGLWSPVFFAGYPLIGKSAWWLGLGVIVALAIVVIRLILLTRSTSRLTSWLLVPYLAWLLYATSLNLGIIVLN